jgi:hypothetical protein
LPAHAIPVERGLGPLVDLWALWCAAAVLLATELPLAGRVAAAALVIRGAQRWVRARRHSRGQWYLLPPFGCDPDWYLGARGRMLVLRRIVAGHLPGCGWLVRFEVDAGPGWLWIPVQALSRHSGRRLRAAITAGRT